MARAAEALAVSWNTANDAVPAEGKRFLIDDPGRFDGVEVIGVDEQCRRARAKPVVQRFLIPTTCGVRGGT